MKTINLFNLKSLLLVFILGFAACSSEDNENNFDLNARYLHLIEDCDNSNNPEVNCIEFIEFNDLGIVNVLIGGSDIVFQTEYNINESKVTFEQSSGLNYAITFTIINDNTLKRIEDGEMWIKDN